MNEERLKRIPYGESDYEAIRTENSYYVDKTGYLSEIEKAGKYLFFIRPRRFGKTLFLSMMETYYDIAKKDRFDFFYQGTAIHKNPTAERNSYLILKFNFSLISPEPDNVEESFITYILDAADLFISKYHHLLGIDVKETAAEIKSRKTASDILRSLISLCKKSERKLYVIIDEYDNFANKILSSAGSRDYKKITRGEGFFRTFFNVLKGGTSGSGAPISRLFVTGVSPITLDDVTSGFNIGENISIDAAFNRMLGFTRDDVQGILDYYKAAGSITHETGFLMDIIDNWYGNYLFSKYAKDKMYNADMVFYFLKEYFKNRSIPDELIDLNVKIDYGKLRHLIIVDSESGKKGNGNFGRLKQVIEQGEIYSNLEKGFSVENLNNTKSFVSLLFYFGLLTIDGAARDQTRFRIPNETVKRLYYDYIMEGHRETDVFSPDLSKYADLMSSMAYEGKWQPLFDYITGLMRESMSLRDLISGEKSIQAFLNVYLGLSNLYIIHTEKELNKGYADIVMEPFLPRYEGIGYSYILEIKYIPKGDVKGQKGMDSKIERLEKEAAEQLRRYVLDKKFKKYIEKTTLIKLVLIFSGSELLHIAPV